MEMFGSVLLLASIIGLSFLVGRLWKPQVFLDLQVFEVNDETIKKMKEEASRGQSKQEEGRQG